LFVPPICGGKIAANAAADLLVTNAVAEVLQPIRQRSITTCLEFPGVFSENT
jgi:hypothetical protein